MAMRIDNTSNILNIAQQALSKYSKEEIYYNYNSLHRDNDNTHLETIHTRGGMLSAATLCFEDGSELIITKEIVAVIACKNPKRRY